MLNKMNISQKAISAFLILSLICVAVGGATVFNIFSSKAASAQNIKLNALLDETTDLELKLGQHAVVANSYMLSSDEKYRTQFESETGKLKAHFDDLSAKVADVAPDQVSAINTAKQTWLSYSEDWMGQQFRMMERVDSVDYARAREGEGEGRRRFNETSKQLAQVATQIHGLANTASQNAAKASNWILIIAIAGAVITLSASIGLGLMFNMIVSRPLRRIRDVTMELADGKMDVRVPTIEAQDEVGDVSRALKVFQENLKRTAELEKEQAEAKVRAEREKQETMAKFAKSFEDTVMSTISEITHSIESLKNASDSVMDAAETTGRRANEVSTSTSQTANNVTAVAGAAEEMSVTIADISSQVAEVANMANEGEKAGNDVTQQVKTLGKVVTDIESVVRLIADIAEQTNLLALNATIEAARAGEAGKGFAVVASEVKDLASQTAKATSDVAAQIAAVRRSAGDVEAASDIVGSVILKLNDVSGALAAAMQQQDGATKEIAANVDSAASSASVVSTNISEVASIAHETGQAARQIGSEADELVKRARFVQSQSAEFIKQLLAS